MKQYKATVKCDVCNKDICMPAARIEWGYSNQNEMHICHHDCSYGMSRYSGSLRDIILDQGLYDAELVYQRLSDIPTQPGGVDKNACDRIKDALFI